MKILYITTVNVSEQSGVALKINGQIKAMRKAGFEVALIYATTNTINYVNKKGVKILLKYQRLPVLGFFNMVKNLYAVSWSLIQKENYESVFLRYSLSDWYFIRFLKKLKSQKIKVFLEIASYPYDMEYKNKSLLKKIGLLIDKFYRIQLSNYVDYCFTPSRVDKNVYSIPTIFFDNAVDIEEITKRKYKGAKKNVLRLIAVANVSPWHGYERVLYGISNYKGKFKISFNIVGEGSELKNLKELTEKLKIQDKVIFHGKKFGKELDEVYNVSDIGVGALGMYKINVSVVSSLKSREYFLKSLPFISIKEDLDAKNNKKYAFLVENNNKYIDMSKVIKFFEKIKNQNYLEEMRTYGEKNLSWEKKFEKVINTMKKCK